MLSVDYFWAINFERGFVSKLKHYQDYINNKKMLEEFEAILLRANSIDYDELNKILAEIGYSHLNYRVNMRQKLFKKYTEAAKDFNDIGDIILQDTDGYHYVFAISEEQPTIERPRHYYRTLLNMKLIRDDKEFKITEETFLKAVKLIKKREHLKDIPQLNYNSINKRKNISLVIDKIENGYTNFPVRPIVD